MTANRLDGCRSAEHCRRIHEFLAAQGWPYLLVPFIPIAIALDIADASDGADLRLLGARGSSRPRR